MAAGFWSTLIQVVVWCLTTSSHYLNQCWLRSCDIDLTTILNQSLMEINTFETAVALQEIWRDTTLMWRHNDIMISQLLSQNKIYITWCCNYIIIMRMLAGLSKVASICIIIAKVIRGLHCNRCVGAHSPHNTYQTLIGLCIRCTNHSCDSWFLSFYSVTIVLGGIISI